MSSTEPRPAEPGPGLRVLVLEDNAADAMVAQAAVARAGRGTSTVLRAETVAEALRILASDTVHLVLLDLNLPDSRGMATLRRVRGATRCPIIVVTAEDRPGLDEEALDEGAFEILHKGKLGAETIARLLRLAEGQRRTQERLEGAEQAAREALLRSEARFRSLTELSSDWYWEQDAELRMSFLSTGFGRSSGTTADKLLGKRRWDEPNRFPLSGTWDDHRKLLEARQEFRDFEYIRVGEDGSRRYISLSGGPIFDAAGAFMGYRGVGRNITQRKQAEHAVRQSEARFRSLTELSSDWYWEQDENLRFTYVSQGFTTRASHDAEQVLGRRRWEFDDVIPASGSWEEHRRQLAAREPFRDFEQVNLRADGTRMHISSSGQPVYDEAGSFRGYRGVGKDITERKAAEDRLAQLARFDPVTGLANRNLLQERVEHAIAQSRRRGRGAGVLFVDLDRFKLVNDTYGHHVGDELLRQAGARLTNCVRRDDTVSRLGGDEFAVLIADLARPDDAALVAQKILDAFVEPFDLGGHETFVTASIGVATFPNDGEGTDTLLKCADVAMYRAKESSRNAFCFYTAEMNARAASKLQLNTDLRRAVERGEFRLHYQPKVNLATGEMIGMEALLRWQHAQRGLVQPLEFIPALEDSGMILAVGDWVLGEACRQLQQWSQAGLLLAPVAVNLSAKQFRRRDLDKVIHRMLSEHGISPALLELEVTESCLMEDPKDAIRQLQALREAGLRISVDDFGTGYSSLAYLTRLPLSTLKIDRGFVNAATTEPGSAAIVKMVIDMAQRLNFDVVAEGIETAQQVAFLMQHGCEQGQGYHFGRPIPADDIAPRLQRK